MTAIAGLWRFDRRPGCAADCDRMLAAQEMYGPDDRAQWSDSTVALGRQLFRILPEDDEDRGPVVSRDGQTVLVADVRLDNRAELIAALGKSAADARYLCDANLLLACIEHWSMGALDRVVGDFAFALWDGRRQQMTLARDFMGQKPLHYHCGKGFFAFASMAKGLHALSDIPYAPDEQTMAEFLALTPQSGPRSFFQDISRIEQGHVVTITREGVSSRRYWNPTRPARGAAAPRDWVEGVRHHLDMATQARLRGAGGSIGSHLSSGFDSSAVTATAARMMASDGGRVTAFTSVPSVLPDNPAKSSRILDEGPLAAATAALYPNIEHVKLKTGHKSPMDGMDRSFHLFAVEAGIEILQRLFELAGILSGDLGVALLVSLDVALQRIPDQHHVALGALAVGPARQDELGVKLDARILDLATPVRQLLIADRAAEFHPGRAGMTHVRVGGRRTAAGELAVEVVGGAAADIEILVGFRDDRLRRADGRQQNGENECSCYRRCAHSGSSCRAIKPCAMAAGDATGSRPIPGQSR